MLSQEEIAEQQQLLTTYRRTLATYLQQQAAIGELFAPPSLRYGIVEARYNIRRLKEVLLATGMNVIDDPDDEESLDLLPPNVSSPVVATPPIARSQRVSRLVVILILVSTITLLAFLAFRVNLPYRDTSVSSINITTPAPQFPSSGTTSALQQSGLLRAGMDAKLEGGKIIVKILTLRLDPLNTEKRTLRVTVRLTNNSESMVSVYETLFRLIVDEVPRAPTDYPDERVSVQSAKEFDYVFEVPSNTNKVVLRLFWEQEVIDIPLELTPSMS